MKKDARITVRDAELRKKVDALIARSKEQGNELTESDIARAALVEYFSKGGGTELAHMSLVSRISNLETRISALESGIIRSPKKS